MMDKILLIDFQNSLHRANVSFGSTKGLKHILCNDCDEYAMMHMQGQNHCICGGSWLFLENRCEAEPDNNSIIIFNWFRNLRPIIEMFSPDKCYMCLDGYPKFRHDLYSEYKANRIIKTASQQINKDKISEAGKEIISLLKFLPVTICKAEAYEADDTIATLAENMKEEHITVLSNDSDYIQLLQKGYKHCQVYNPIKKETMEAPPYPYVAWKCLAGDKADNIPALLKPKQVLRTLNDPGIFAQFMAVEENRSRFNINRQLIEFKMVPEEEIILSDGTKNFPALKKEFARMEFASIINDNSWEKYTNTFKCLKY